MDSRNYALPLTISWRRRGQVDLVKPEGGIRVLTEEFVAEGLCGLEAPTCPSIELIRAYCPIFYGSV